MAKTKRAVGVAAVSSDRSFCRAKRRPSICPLNRIECTVKRQYTKVVPLGTVRVAGTRVQH